MREKSSLRKRKSVEGRGGHYTGLVNGFGLVAGTTHFSNIPIYGHVNAIGRLVESEASFALRGQSKFAIVEA